MGLRRLKRWDIFCSVVDNYGDVGVAWRLARQLATEYALAVRLYVDDRARLARLAPDGVCSVDVRDWLGAQGAFAVDRADAPADVVIEAFGCGLPPALLDAMEAAVVQPVWINLEYLSAEPWIDERHGLASRQPLRPLTRHFYFPGFTPASGGLLRERGIVGQRDAFLAEPSARLSLWKSLAVAPPDPGALLVSMFCYPNAALPPLLDAWAEGDRAIACFVPEGVGRRRNSRMGGPTLARPGESLRRGRSGTFAVRASSPQDDYDRLSVGVRPQLRARRGFVRTRAVGGAAAGLACLSAGRGRASGQARGVSRAVWRGARACGRGSATRLCARVEWRSTWRSTENGRPDGRPGLASLARCAAGAARFARRPGHETLAAMPDLAARLVELVGKVL